MTDPARARLRASLEAALRGRPRIAVICAASDEIVADLTAEILSAARDAGARGLAVACSRDDLASPYAGLARLTAAVLDLPEAPGGAAARLAQLASGAVPGIMPGSVLGGPPAAGYFEHLLGLPVTVPALNGMDPGRLRQGAFLALGDLLIEAAEEEALVVAISGLQWAAAPTREWLERVTHRLAAEEQGVRLLLLLGATARLPALPSRPGGDLEVLTIDLGASEPVEPAGEPEPAPENPPGQAARSALARLAEALARQQQGDHREAISCARRALLGFEALGRPVDAAMAHGLAGNCYQRLGEWELAQLEHEAALAIRERIGDVAGIATSLNNLAILSGSLGRWQGAHQYYLRSLALARRMGEFRAVAVVLGNLGDLLLARGEYAEAERRLLEALEIAARTGDQGAEIVIVGNLAAVYVARNAPAQALEALDRCLGLIERTGQRFYEPEVRYFRGRAYQLLANVAAARLEHEIARSLAENHGHLAFLGVVDRALAELAEGSGRKDEAYELALRAEQALRPAGMPLEHARTLAVLARLAPPGKREEWAQSALAYFERLGARREAEKMRDEVPVQSRLSGSDDLKKPSGPRTSR